MCGRTAADMAPVRHPKHEASGGFDSELAGYKGDRARRAGTPTDRRARGRMRLPTILPHGGRTDGLSPVLQSEAIEGGLDGRVTLTRHRIAPGAVEDRDLGVGIADEPGLLQLAGDHRDGRPRRPQHHRQELVTEAE